MEKTERLTKKFDPLQVLLSPEVSVLIPLIILCIVTAINCEKFLTAANLLIILRYCAFIGCLAIGEAFALMCGEIDLSVGTCSMFTSMVFGYFLVEANMGLVVAIIAALIAGALVGCVNAFFTLVCKVNSWISTMSMQYICSGFATVITNGRIVRFSKWGPGIQEFAAERPLGLSWMFWIFIAFIVVGEIAVRYTPIGRKVHAVGLSVSASSVAGINVKLTKWLCMTFSGFMAAVCGILQSFSTNASSPQVGAGNDFPAIICCVVGGVSNMGGKGTMLGCLLGVIIYQTLKNCLQMLGANANLQLVLVGIILIMAVYVDVLKTKISRRPRKAVTK